MNGELPINVITLYTLFTLFQYYQALHVKNFQGAGEGALLAINVSAFAGMIFSYGYLIYYGYAVAWYWPILLFVIALAIKSVWFFVEAKLGLHNHEAEALFSLAGFVILPVTGYFLLVSIPA